MIYLFGDIHGIEGLVKFKAENFKPGPNLTKNDYVIILGDFGIPWFSKNSYTYRQELQYIKALSDCPWTTLFIDGNHENFDNLDSFEKQEFNGGIISKLEESVFWLNRGYIFNLENKKFFVMGGAISLDKQLRTPGISWWSREIPNYEEYIRGVDSLVSVNYEVDYILSHTPPYQVISECIRKDIDLLVKDPVCEYFDMLKPKLKYKKWFSGHLHFDYTGVNEKEFVLYNKYIELNTSENKIQIFDLFLKSANN